MHEKCASALCVPLDRQICVWEQHVCVYTARFIKQAIQALKGKNTSLQRETFNSKKKTSHGTREMDSSATKPTALLESFPQTETHESI